VRTKISKGKVEYILNSEQTCFESIHSKCLSIRAACKSITGQAQMVVLVDSVHVGVVEPAGMAPQQLRQVVRHLDHRRAVPFARELVRRFRGRRLR